VFLKYQKFNKKKYFGKIKKISRKDLADENKLYSKLLIEKMNIN
jgi:hypothetical protein